MKEYFSHVLSHCCLFCGDQFEGTEAVATFRPKAYQNISLGFRVHLDCTGEDDIVTHHHIIPSVYDQRRVFLEPPIWPVIIGTASFDGYLRLVRLENNMTRVAFKGEVPEVWTLPAINALSVKAVWGYGPNWNCWGIINMPNSLPNWKVEHAVIEQRFLAFRDTKTIDDVPELRYLMEI